MKVLAMLQALDMHRLRGTPKGICTDRNIGKWKGRSTELTAALKCRTGKQFFCITVHYPTESSATVPLKPLRKRSGGGIGTSQQSYINFKLHKFKGSSMTKKSKICSENQKG